MFHHFHDKNHIKSQGSISSRKFEDILINLKKKYNLISANIFFEKLIKNTIKDNDVCLTFDDGLKCQYEIAFPIMKRHNLTAFFFIYSQIFKKIPKLEIYRDFRFRCYKNLREFYKSFFEIFFQNNKKIPRKKIINHLKKYKFYSFNDRKFRLIRDEYLTSNKFNSIMNKMMKQKNYDLRRIGKKLIMNRKDIKSLVNHGNIIGLHSHSHDIHNINNNNLKKLYLEYNSNKMYLDKIFKIKTNSVSYPFGRYNSYTLKVMKKLDIKCGFISNFNSKKIKNKLLISRIDHNIL